MSLQTEAEQLARELFETRSKLRASGRALHDQVGPLLSAAGIRLNLLRSDHPQAAAEIEPALFALEEAMDRVRTLSRDLNPPPGAHLGLKKALMNLAERHAGGFAGDIRFSYTAAVTPPDDAVAAIYEAASGALSRVTADRSAEHVSISVSGARQLVVKIESDGRLRWPAVVLSGLERRGRPAGISLDAVTLNPGKRNNGKPDTVSRGTMVSIRYAARSTAGR